MHEPRSPLFHTALRSPIGELLLVGDGESLHAVHLPSRPPAAAPGRADPGPFAAAVEQLAAYFAGELRSFDLPLRISGTAFQRQVWQALRAIPFGETRSYGEIAAALGRAGAARAVGAANHCNPLPIVVPCHRVVGADGSLTGFRGGLAAKRWLLEHERACARAVAGRLPLAPDRAAERTRRSLVAAGS